MVLHESEASGGIVRRIYSIKKDFEINEWLVDSLIGSFLNFNEGAEELFLFGYPVAVAVHTD